MEEIIRSRVQLLQQAKEKPELQSIEYELCRKDILYFFRNYLYTDKNTNLYPADYPAILPMIPYEFQEELVREVWESILNGALPLEERTCFTNVFIEKSRQMGISWLIMAIFVYWFIFHNHKYHVISQKETDVDKIGDMRSLLQKCRFIINNLPVRMLPKWLTKNTGTETNKYMSLSRLDWTGSITGESANPNASRSGTYNAVFMDEMAFMSNASTINTAAASATPCRIFNSTPNWEGNEFWRMRELTMDRRDSNWQEKLAEVKWLRYHWSDHPLYTKEWYDWKIKGMTREKIAQELEIDYNTAIVWRVYTDFPKVPTSIFYNESKPLYVAIDNSHWGTDPNAIICFQLDWYKYKIIDAVEVDKWPADCADFLSCQPKFQMTTPQEQFLERYKDYNWKRATFISDPYDTKSAMGNSTILDDYKKVWINLFLPKERRKEEQILKTRANIYRIEYNDNCLDFASAIMNARYPERKEESNSTKAFLLPVHNWTSHYRTALEYGITYVLENPIIDKQRILEDTRPQRNYITWDLIYKKSLAKSF
jgi:hypothetical protein